MNLLMPICCVVDASVVVKLVLTEPHSDKVAALFQHLAKDANAEFLAPDLLDLECGNILWKHVRRSGLDGDDATSFLADIVALAVRRVSVTTLVTEALELAKTQDISVYDASYVAVARQTNFPLITADTRLVGKMAGHTVKVVDMANLILP